MENLENDILLKKRLLMFISLGLIFSFGLQFFAVNVVLNEENITSGDGFTFFIAIIIIIYPLFFTIHGLLLSRWIFKVWWVMPIVGSFFYLSMLIFYKSHMGLFYAINYTVVGIAFMIIGHYFEKYKQKKLNKNS